MTVLEISLTQGLTYGKSLCVLGRVGDNFWFLEWRVEEENKHTQSVRGSIPSPLLSTAKAHASPSTAPGNSLRTCRFHYC